MTAYNRTKGEPCSASPTLLADILRGEWEWGFTGHVVSDCGAVEDIHTHHLARAVIEPGGYRIAVGGGQPQIQTPTPAPLR